MAVFMKALDTEVVVSDNTVFNSPVNVKNVLFVNINEGTNDGTTFYKINFKMDDGCDMEWIYTDSTRRDIDFNKIKAINFSNFDSTGMLLSQHEDVVIDGQVVWKNTPINPINCKSVSFYNSELGSLINDADYGIIFKFDNNYTTMQLYTNESDLMDDWNNLVF